MKHTGMEYKGENLLSLAGVYQPKKEIGKSKIPVALSLFLEKHPGVDTIYLHLDNDKNKNSAHLSKQVPLSEAREKA